MAKTKLYKYKGAVAVQLKQIGKLGAMIESMLPVEVEIESEEQPTAEAALLEAFCEAGEQASAQLDEMFPDRLIKDDEETDDEETDDEEEGEPE